MEVKKFVVSELEKADKISSENNLHYGIIFWESPISHNIEKRIVFSNSYCEVTEWVNNAKKNYENIFHVEYVDGVIY